MPTKESPSSHQEHGESPCAACAATRCIRPSAALPALRALDTTPYCRRRKLTANRCSLLIRRIRWPPDQSNTTMMTPSSRGICFAGLRRPFIAGRRRPRCFLGSISVRTPHAFLFLFFLSPCSLLLLLLVVEQSCMPCLLGSPSAHAGHAHQVHHHSCFCPYRQARLHACEHA